MYIILWWDKDNKWYERLTATVDHGGRRIEPYFADYRAAITFLNSDKVAMDTRLDCIIVSIADNYEWVNPHNTNETITMEFPG